MEKPSLCAIDLIEESIHRANIKQETDEANDIGPEAEMISCSVEIKDEPYGSTLFSQDEDIDFGSHDVDKEIETEAFKQNLRKEEKNYDNYDQNPFVYYFNTPAVSEEKGRSPRENGQGMRAGTHSPSLLERDRVNNGSRTKIAKNNNGKKTGLRGVEMDQKTQLIIETVKKYPVLYDITHTDYKQNKIKSKIWDDIAEVTEERSGDAVKSRWRNLKDAYNKHLRANKTDQAAKTVERYKSWPWGEHMAFLQPYLVFSTDSNVQTDCQSEDTIKEEPDSSQLSSSQHPSSRLEESSSTSQQPSVQQTSCTLEEPQSTSHPRRSRRKRRSDTNDSKDFLKRRYMEHDETDLIFLGYSRTIKRMSKSRQAIVKFQIAKLIMEAELENAEESSTSAK